MQKNKKQKKQNKMKLKIFIVVLVIIGVIAVAYFCFFKKQVYIPNGFCVTSADCKTEGACGLGCGYMCVENECKWVHCMEHGTYDWETGNCICNEGYTGYFCEQKQKK